MASDKLFTTIITVIIIVLVLIIAIWGIAKLNAAGMLDDLFPNFGLQGNKLFAFWVCQFEVTPLPTRIVDSESNFFKRFCESPL